MKRILSILLSVLFLLAALPLGAIPVAAATSGTTGDCTWTLDGTHLTISGNGAMGDYTYDSPSPWGTSITLVTIEDGVTSIGASAFSSCDSLVTVTIPDSVITIGNAAFYGCTSLTSVTIPDGVTSIGASAFSSCDSLVTVTIPDSVITIGNAAFYGCTSLTSVTIPDGVTTVGMWAFVECNSLMSVIIGNNVTAIGKYEFAHCDALTTVTIGDNVSSIGRNAFSRCDSLTSITVSGSNAYYCSEKGVLFNRDKTSLVKCPSGKNGTYTIPEGVVNVESYAFERCMNLTSVIVSNSVEEIKDRAFSGCNSLTSIVVSENNPNYSSENGVLFDKNKTTLIQCPGGKVGDYSIPNSVISIGGYAFEDCDSLIAVTIPNSVSSIVYAAFANCSALTKIAIPTSVIAIDYSVFRDCDSLSNVYYSGNEEMAADMDIREGNESLLKATWHYNWTGGFPVVPGDANGDGKVNVKDLGLLQQKLNGWDVTVIDDTCDVNADGKVNVKDLGLLQQYLNGWDVELLLPEVATGEMVWPVPICQNIGRGYSDGHSAIDICNGPIPISGKPCVAADSGMVVYAGWYYDYGYIVKIQHTDELVTMYAHLESFVVTTGQQVTRGQTIGLVGNSGDASYAHLHFEVIKDGERVNPLDHVTPSK